MRLTTTAAWSLGTAGLCVAMAAGGWFGLVAPQQAQAAASRELTVAAQEQNSSLEIRIAQLEQEFVDLPTRQAELAAIKQALPEEPALAPLIREVDRRGADTGVVVDSLTAGVPTAVVDLEAATAVTAAPSAGASAEPSTEASAAPSAAAPAPAAGAEVGGVVTPTAPVLAAIPVTITATGGLAESTLFLTSLQAEMPRALLVDALTLSVLEGEDNPVGTVQTVITARVFAFVDPTEVAFTDVVQPTTEPSDG